MGRVLDSRLSQINTSINTIPYAQSLRDNLQATINYQFSNASDYFTIQKESSTIPNLYEDIGVRITVPYQLSQRYTIKDDCRQLIFASNDVENNLGDRYQFNNFYWLTVDTGRVETPTNSCQLERCNSTLKFYDENGDYNETPCIAQSKSVYDVKMDQYIWIPNNQMRVLVKHNDISKLIDIDRRFLINGLPWRVGSKDVTSFVRNGYGYEEMFFKSDFISDNDENGIADAKIQKATYNISILNSNNSQVDISTPLQLNIEVNKIINNISTILFPTPSLLFTSSNLTIATVSSLGIVSFLTEGNVDITCSLASDNTVSDTISIDVISMVVDNYTYTLTDITLIKLNQSATYIAKRYNNSVDTGDEFDFEVINDSVPTSKYLLTIIDGNSCSLKCLGYPYTITLRAYLRSDHSIFVDRVVILKGLI